MNATRRFSKHIEAEITFLLPEDGGRAGPVFSGFRPNFVYDDQHWIATLWSENQGLLPKGIPIKVFFEFIHPHAHLGKLFPGKGFELWDGRVIAKGRILQVFDLENDVNAPPNNGSTGTNDSH